jgi:hypothetical protein
MLKPQLLGSGVYPSMQPIGIAATVADATEGTYQGAPTALHHGIQQVFEFRPVRRLLDKLHRLADKRRVGGYNLLLTLGRRLMGDGVAPPDAGSVVYTTMLWPMSVGSRGQPVAPGQPGDRPAYRNPRAGKRYSITMRCSTAGTRPRWWRRRFAGAG